jgi:hypothetical protein
MFVSCTILNHAYSSFWKNGYHSLILALLNMAIYIIQCFFFKIICPSFVAFDFTIDNTLSKI